jgi:hypothetical protein
MSSLSVRARLRHVQVPDRARVQYTAMQYNAKPTWLKFTALHTCAMF